ncbi:MAG TPA: helix-turn-helix domain-containing protein [Candidatus Lokiarchaeia archaeon]|nr:helix-turn-helix domain-containing protein [Candidatus Lokiarchaeia archaeon]
MQSLANQTVKILLIEDSEDDALIIVRAIRKGKIEVNTHRVDSKEGLIAALDANTWDVVLCDYQMPYLDPFDAFNIVKEKGLDIPFIVVSGKIGEETAVQALKAGMHNYIMKDHLARLVPAIQREIEDAILRRERRWTEDQLEKYRNDLEQMVQKRTAELEKTTRQLKVTLQSIADGVITTDVQGNVTLLNPVAEKLTGWSNEKSIGKPLSEVLQSFNEETDAPVHHIFENVLNQQSGLSYPGGVVIQSKSGEGYYVLLKTAPLLSETKSFLGAVIVLHDVTDQKNCQELETKSGKLDVKYDVVLAILQIPIPVESWLAEVSKLYPNLIINIQMALTSMARGQPFKDINTVLAQFSSPDWEVIVQIIENHPRVLQVNKWSGDENSILINVKYEYGRLFRIVQQSECMHKYPIVVQDGTSSWELLGPRDKIDQFLSSLDQLQILYDLVSIKSFQTRRDHEELTERQETVLQMALKYGYFETPRRITLAELAKRLNIATSTLSGILRRISRKRMTQ